MGNTLNNGYGNILLSTSNSSATENMHKATDGNSKIITKINKAPLKDMNPKTPNTSLDNRMVTRTNPNNLTPNGKEIQNEKIATSVFKISIAETANDIKVNTNKANDSAPHAKFIENALSKFEGKRSLRETPSESEQFSNLKEALNKKLKSVNKKHKFNFRFQANRVIKRANKIKAGFEKINGLKNAGKISESECNKYKESLVSLFADTKSGPTHSAEFNTKLEGIRAAVEETVLKANRIKSFCSEGTKNIKDEALKNASDKRLDSIAQECGGNEKEFKARAKRVIDRAIEIDKAIDEIGNLSEDDKKKLINLLDEKDDSIFNKKLSSLSDEILEKNKKAQVNNVAEVDDVAKATTEEEKIAETRQAEVHRVVIDFMKQENNYLILGNLDTFNIVKKLCIDNMTKNNAQTMDATADINGSLKDKFASLFGVKIYDKALKNALDKRLDSIAQECGGNEKEFIARAKRVIDRAIEIDKAIDEIGNLSEDDKKKLINLLYMEMKTEKKSDSEFDESLKSLKEKIQENLSTDDFEEDKDW